MKDGRNLRVALKMLLGLVIALGSAMLVNQLLDIGQATQFVAAGTGAAVGLLYLILLMDWINK